MTVGEVRGCRFPEDLYYWVERHVWARPEGDEVVVGMTDPAQKMAGKILYVSPKKVGRTVTRGESVGTVESGKYVGPVPSPVAGEIVAVNETIKKQGSVVNEDPYGAGWVARIRPSQWDQDAAALVTGPAAVEAYRQKLEADNVSCN